VNRCAYDAGPGAKPRAGDVLRTARGHLHLVRTSRPVRSRVAPRRFALELDPCDDAAAAGRCVLPLRWYPRGRRSR
jgi:hypothetical protein